MITLEQFSAMIPRNKNPEEWYDAAQQLFKAYDITTDLRIAGFMAQCAHESADFTRLEENLNYSEKALNSVFGRYFGEGKRDAKDYARDPKKIANYVYQDEFRSKRGALGNTDDGDGWRFRGRGIKQLTGRNNYTAFGKSVDMSAEEAAEYVATPAGAIESACWFWKTNKLEKYADNDDNLGLTKKINGGTIGLEDRDKRYKDAKAILAGKCKAGGEGKKSKEVRTLRKGMKGDDVAKMQKALGIAADGDFGFGTQTAVKKWQKLNGLVADGIVGPATQAKLLG
jgi:putative chitinase|tara:strand:- start:15514 stop:16365 length:852 start_codon:yes stop_codon:yes gene_type:complete